MTFLAKNRYFSASIGLGNGIVRRSGILSICHLLLLVQFGCSKPEDKVASYTDQPGLHEPREEAANIACPAKPTQATYYDLHSSANQLNLLAEFKHHIPWQAGTAFQVTQGHASSTHGARHLRQEEIYSWDFGMATGTRLLASTHGTIRRIQDGFGPGNLSTPGNEVNLVVIYWDDNSGRESLYLHLSSVNSSLREGDKVRRGDFIGLSGESGAVSGPHLHYQVQSGATGAQDHSSSWYQQSVFANFTDVPSGVDLINDKRIASNMDPIDPVPPTPIEEGEDSEENDESAHPIDEELRDIPTNDSTEQLCP